MHGRPTFWGRLRARALLGLVFSVAVSGLQGWGFGEEPGPFCARRTSWQPPRVGVGKATRSRRAADQHTRCRRRASAVDSASSRVRYASHPGGTTAADLEDSLRRRQRRLVRHPSTDRPARSVGLAPPPWRATAPSLVTRPDSILIPNSRPRCLELATFGAATEAERPRGPSGTTAERPRSTGHLDLQGAGFGVLRSRRCGVVQGSGVGCVGWLERDSRRRRCSPRGCSGGLYGDFIRGI